ncbi:MAG: zinc-binding dehydrogenase [Actinomycetota bacterium]|nr:zinc-binding dehydrogenase [Actinomycetota bacterium]
MKALVVERSLPRFAAARLRSTLGMGPGGAVSPVRLADVDAPRPPGPGWHLVRTILSGICGSDLATVEGRSSRWFEPIVSFPFVPGHEVVGHVDSDPSDRVVLEAVLSCASRGIDPPCAACASGRVGNCESISLGALSPGLQTGFCCDTGGGWAGALVAHESQLHRVPDELSDTEAVLAEPVACGVHAALAAPEAEAATVAVVGAGTVGLAVTAALHRFVRPASLVVSARHTHQQKLAVHLGADVTVGSEGTVAAVRRVTRTMTVGGRLTGGADVVYDCVGSAQSLHESLAVVRPRGTIVLAGMPSPARVDLTPLWQREVKLAGAYAYGLEDRTRGARSGDGRPGGVGSGDGGSGDGRRSSFDMAFELVAAAGLGRLVSASYPLDRHEEALAHASSAGRRGAVKIVFEPGARRTPPSGRQSRSAQSRAREA